MSTVYFLDTTYTVPNGAGPERDECYTVWINNPRGLEDWIFDTNKAPAGVLPHDHQERRGAPLWIPFWYTSFGPQGAEGGAANAWTQGIPLYPPVAGVYDFTVTPKCLGWWPFRIPAQVKTFHLEFLVYLDGATVRTVTLKAIVRPLSEVGLDHDQGIGPSSSVTTQQTSGGARVTRDQFTFSDLSVFGDPGLDKEDLVLEIWLMSNPVAGTLYRLLCAAAVANSTYAVGLSEPIEGTPARSEVALQEIATNEFLFSDTAQRAHLRYNQVTLQALGRSPGLEANLNTEREGDPYQTTIILPHKHRGRRYLDPDSDLPVYDGAVQRRLLWLAAPYANYGDSAADMTNQPAQGIKLHSGGSAATQAELKGRVSLPIGQRSLFIRFAVKPGTAVEVCRLYFYIAFTTYLNETVPFTVNSQGLAPSSTKSGAFTVVDVLPVDNSLWQSNNIRLSNGLGVWTEDAAKDPYPQTAIDAGRIPRVSRVVTISFDLPFVDYPYILRCKWALETGARGSGTFASNARLAYAVASVPPGF